MMEATGNKVVLEKQEYSHATTYGDIILPDAYDRSSRLCKGKIMSIGSQARCLNLNVGDMVLYDTFSVFYDTYPLVVTKVENIIVRFNEEEVDD